MSDGHAWQAGASDAPPDSTSSSRPSPLGSAPDGCPLTPGTVSGGAGIATCPHRICASTAVDARCETAHDPREPAGERRAELVETEPAPDGGNAAGSCPPHSLLEARCKATAAGRLGPRHDGPREIARANRLDSDPESAGQRPGMEGGDFRRCTTALDLRCAKRGFGMLSPRPEISG